MNKYCLYYFPPKSETGLGDNLFVNFGGNLRPDKSEKGESVDKMYCKDQLIGYLIHHFSEYCKLKVSGPLYLPNDQIVDIINDVLSNAGLSGIDYVDKSGYVVGEIKDKKALKKSFLYKVMADRELNVESTFDLNIGKKIVVATNGTYLMPGMMVNSFVIEGDISSDGRICSNQDLNIEPYDEFFPVIVDDEAINGEDFFKVERREYDA